MYEPPIEDHTFQYFHLLENYTIVGTEFPIVNPVHFGKWDVLMWDCQDLELCREIVEDHRKEILDRLYRRPAVHHRHEGKNKKQCKQ